MQFNLSLTIGFYLTHCAKHQNFTRILLPHRMEDLTVKSYPNFSLNFKHTSSYMVIASNHYMMLLRAIAFNSKFNSECRHIPLYTIAFGFSNSVGLLHFLFFFLRIFHRWVFKRVPLISPLSTMLGGPEITPPLFTIMTWEPTVPES